MKTYKAPRASSPQAGNEVCVNPQPQPHPRMFSWKRHVFLEEDKSPQEAASWEVMETEAVGRRAGEAFRQWSAMVCEKFFLLR